MKTKNYRSTSKCGSSRSLLPRGEGQDEGQTSTPEVQVLSLPLNLNRKSQIQNRKLNRRHQVARSRAAWWFGQMRKAVNAAVEWKPAPLARPEQTYITLNTGR
jgi:hypothetical protein